MSLDLQDEHEFDRSPTRRSISGEPLRLSSARIVMPAPTCPVMGRLGNPVVLPARHTLIHMVNYINDLLIIQENIKNMGSHLRCAEIPT
jgi:hypothetical protein